jgi:glutamate dehydrogenase
LDAYFPGILRSDWSAEISQHPLRREIVATQLANIAVNECGLSAIYRLTEETECSTPIAIKALMAARKITGLDMLWDPILADDSSWPARLAMALESRRYIDRVARWLIAHRGPEFDFASDVELFSQAVTVIRQRLTTDLRGAERERWERGAEMFIERGASPETALIVSGLLDEFAALDLQLKSQVSDVDLEVWSDVYFAVSDAISGDVLLTSISSLQRDDHWQTLARAALRADMYTVLASVTEQIVVRRSDFTFEQWRARHAATLQRIESMISDMNKKSSADIAVLSVALRLVRELAAQTATSAR